MKLAQVLNQFSWFFIILGQSCHYLGPDFELVKTANPLYVSVKYIIPIISIFVTIIDACVGSFYVICCTKYASTHYLIYGLYLATLLLTMGIVTTSSIFLWNRFTKLYTQLRNVEQLTKKRYSMDFQGFRKEFVHKLCTITISYTITFVVTSYIIPGTQNDYLVNMSLFVPNLFTTFTSFYTLFYVDLLKYLMIFFVRHLERQTTNMQCNDIGNLRKEIIFYKQLHFKLWEVTQTINCLFGWFLVTLFLGSFMYCVYSLYFAFLFIMRTDPTFQYIRNYLIIFSNLLYRTRVCLWVCLCVCACLLLIHLI